VIGDLDSILDGFLLRGTCVSSTHLIDIFGTKCACVPLDNPVWQIVFFSISNSILTGKQGARFSCFYFTSFSLERYMCFFSSAE
jgi:hypothetical protein